MYVKAGSDVANAALRAFPEYRGTKFEVKALTRPKTLHSQWSGGSKSTFRIVPLDPTVSAQMEIPEGTTELKELPVGVALVEHCLFCGKDLGLKVYVRPENLTPMLESKMALTPKQRVALAAMRCLKPAYRSEDCRRLKVDFHKYREELKPLGLVSSNNALTIEGKNLAEDLNRFSLDKEGFLCYDMGRIE